MAPSLGTPSQRIKPCSIRVGFFNANGIQNQREELGEFLRDNQIDVFLIQETFLKPANKDPKLSNYRIVRNDRTHSTLGGTLIYFKRSLHCIPLDPPTGLKNIEVSVCRLAMTGHESITIISAYLSPNKELPPGDLEKLFNMDSSVILAGDLNAKHTIWSYAASNTRGRVLERSLDRLNVDILVPPEPTHYSFNSDNRPDILDLALVKNVSLRMRSIQVLHELDSDHRPVIIDFVPRRGPNNTGPSLPMRWKTDWTSLKSKLKNTSSEALSAIPSNIETAEDAISAVHSLTTHLQGVVSECSREEPTTDHLRWCLPDDLRGVLRERNAARRAYDSYPTEERRSRFRYLQREVKRRMRRERNSRWENHLSEIEPSHTAFWQLTRTLRSGQVATMPPLNRPNQTQAFDDTEKAECLADSLESQCSPSLGHIDPLHIQMVDSYVESRNTPSPSFPLTTQFSPQPDPLRPVSVDEVHDLVKALKTRKSPGSDGISNRVIKVLPEKIISIFTAILNAALRNSLFPPEWKEAVVIGIHKPGKKSNEPTSYRPISLLSSLGKIYERVIYARLNDFAHSRHLIPDEQFGFRVGHSCVHQVHRMTEHILAGFHKKLITGALFFDIAKAFDKVWHNGLLYKLYQYEVPTPLVHIIRDFLSNRGFKYRVEGSLSTRHSISAGVPQGSVLSPLLFSLYTGDIPKPHDAHLAMYADDTAIFTSGRSLDRIGRSLQTAADSLGAWYRKWRIEVNPNKSAAILFHRAGPSPRAPAVKMYDEPIPWVGQVKYLGVILDERMTFTAHTNAVRARAAFALSQLHCLLNRRSKLSIQNKIRIYTACIRPIMTYASPVFAQFSKLREHRLQTIQNRFLRRAFGARWYIRNKNLHVDANLPTIRQFMKVASKRYFDTAENHSNPLIRRASIYTPFDRAKRRRPRHVLTDPDDETTLAIARMNKYDTEHSTNRHNHRSRRRGPRRVPPVPSTGPRAELPAPIPE